MSAKRWTPDYWANSDPDFWAALEWYEANSGSMEDPPEKVGVWKGELVQAGLLDEPETMWDGPTLSDRGRLALDWYRREGTKGKTPASQLTAPHEPRFMSVPEWLGDRTLRRVTGELIKLDPPAAAGWRHWWS